METRSRSRGNGGQPSGSSYSSRKLAQIYLIKWVAAFSFGILHTFLVNLFYKRVPDPYMDEIFHVNQTREYCNGNFTYWNQMITTPATHLRYSRVDWLLWTRTFPQLGNHSAHVRWIDTFTSEPKYAEQLP
ncbi:Dolichyl-P-Glc:Glc(2)Man(9)GlcNAc(2)-PP-dolichol alpha-1,2-glucosyltransferase [Aphelenchoides besseyi]|nr:Dolichyl-P-Glc:Glc(2)Man(9)GlcNAc(2)-PP-dolichol alpha-1,2-glucosyltransferase [Aphelenchoides besseyi]